MSGFLPPIHPTCQTDRGSLVNGQIMERRLLLKHETWNLWHKTCNMKVEKWNMKVETWNMKVETSNMKVETSNMKVDTWNMKVEKSKLKHESRNFNMKQSVKQTGEHGGGCHRSRSKWREN